MKKKYNNIYSIPYTIYIVDCQQAGFEVVGLFPCHCRPYCPLQHKKHAIKKQALYHYINIRVDRYWIQARGTVGIYEDTIACIEKMTCLKMKFIA